LFAKAVDPGDWIILKAVEPGFPISEFMIIRRGMAMKLPTIALAAAVGGSFANAQSGAPSGAGSATR
jgi:hypothetical protein